MTYDKSVFTATVNVVDDGEGNLKASVATYPKGVKSVEASCSTTRTRSPKRPCRRPTPARPRP
ncbi:MAG: Spy0128 family protein [Collinsella sp.]